MEVSGMPAKILSNYYLGYDKDMPLTCPVVRLVGHRQRSADGNAPRSL
jgi:hypothetical protein